MRRARVLAIAVASGRIGYVFLIDGALKDWNLSRTAGRNVTRAVEHTRKWITELSPDFVVTEAISKRSTKSTKTKRLTSAVASVAADAKLLDVQMPRTQLFDNKFEEAKALAEQFPEISSWVPKKRRTWDPEPHNVTLFEALALYMSFRS